MSPVDLAMSFRAPIFVTVAYFGLYYTFLFGQSLSKYYVNARERENAKKSGNKKESFRNIKYFSSDPISLMGDRTVGIMLETQMTFLSALWLHAIFVDPAAAAHYGWFYIATRAPYPLLFYIGSPWNLLSTIPNYICIFLLLKGVVANSMP